MVIRIDFKKVGNHWYPCLKHNALEDLCLEPKIERVLSRIDYGDFGNVTIYVREAHSFMDTRGLIHFTEHSIEQYLNTDLDFLLSFYVGKYHYQISSKLYTLLEKEFDLNFYLKAYQLEVW